MILSEMYFSLMSLWRDSRKRLLPSGTLGGLIALTRILSLRRASWASIAALLLFKMMGRIGDSFWMILGKKGWRFFFREEDFLCQRG